MAELSITGTWYLNGNTPAQTPTSSAGQKQVMWLYRDGSTTPTTQQSGFDWSDLGTMGGDANSGRAQSRTVASTDQSTGTTTNGTNKCGFTISNLVSIVGWTSGGTGADGSSNNIVYPALTFPSLSAGQGAKAIFGGGKRNRTNFYSTVPSGYTLIVAAGSSPTSNGAGMFIADDYGTGDISSFTQAMGATDRWASWGAWLVGDIPTLHSADFFAMF